MSHYSITVYTHVLEGTPLVFSFTNRSESLNPLLNYLSHYVLNLELSTCVYRSTCRPPLTCTIPIHPLTIRSVPLFYTFLFVSLLSSHPNPLTFKENLLTSHFIPPISSLSLNLSILPGAFRTTHQNEIKVSLAFGDLTTFVPLSLSTTYTNLSNTWRFGDPGGDCVWCGPYYGNDTDMSRVICVTSCRRYSLPWKTKVFLVGSTHLLSHTPNTAPLLLLTSILLINLVSTSFDRESPISVPDSEDPYSSSPLQTRLNSPI